MASGCGCGGPHGVGRREFIKLGAGVGASMLGPVAGTSLFAQGAPGNTGSVDVHAHWVPQAYADALVAAEVAADADDRDSLLCHDFLLRRQLGEECLDCLIEQSGLVQVGCMARVGDHRFGRPGDLGRHVVGGG